MKRYLKPALVAAALVVIGVTQSVAGPATLGPMTVTPDEGFPGDAFTISGENCPPAPTLTSAGVGTLAGIPPVFTVTASMTGPGEGGSTYPLGSTVAEDGSWTISATVPEAPAGDYTINAECSGAFPEGASTSLKAAGLVFAGQQLPGGSYDPHPFTILADTPDGGGGDTGGGGDGGDDDGVGDSGLNAPDPVEVQPAFTG